MLIEGNKLYHIYLDLMNFENKKYLAVTELPEYLFSEVYKINHDIEYSYVDDIFKGDKDLDNLKSNMSN